jgi:hypothetical protein
MAALEEPIRQHESQAEVDACLAQTGTTMDQVRRWRREGLLPDVKQVPQAFDGSIVFYPAGTCAQIQAASQLFRQKNRVDFVGRRLWWAGFPVDESHWRPSLQKIAKSADRTLSLLGWAARREERNAVYKLDSPTLGERAAQYSASNIILSRVLKRISGVDLAIFYRVIFELGLGEFSGFEVPAGDEKRARAETATIAGFDFTASEKQSILRHSINFVEALPSSLEAVSAAFSSGSFAEVANASEEEIAQARLDVRNALQIAVCLYEPFKWVYGDGAFGLRLLAWFARKAPDPVMDGLILGMLRLRKVPDAIVPSKQIAQMATEAEACWKNWRRLTFLSQSDPRFSEVLKPKRIKAAFVDEPALKRWRDEVERASMGQLPEKQKGPQ